MKDFTPSRRSFLAGSAAAGAALVIGFNAKGALAAGNEGGLMPNPFVKIAPDGTVTVILKHFEMGQGTTTGLATLVAEEMDADWDAVQIEFAPADASKYANTLFGMQGTGGSTAMANSYMQYRQAGAAARAMLMEAASLEWAVRASEITIDKGVVSHGDVSATFGELVAKVKDTAEPPTEPILKEAKDFKLIGKDLLPRKDTPSKTDGTAIFAMDVAPEGTIYAVMARAPRFGGTVASFDDSAALEVPGVTAVKQTPKGIAVFAEDTWSAIQGRDALSVEWDFSNAEGRSTEEMEAEYAAALDGDGPVARNDAGVEEALAGDNTVEAEFDFPFLAHAPMEPMTCTIQIKDGKAHIWDGSQFPTVTQMAVGAVTGVGQENTTIETVYAGGSFGRRANMDSDYHVEAAMAAVALGTDQPVKLVWTREDDVTGGYYRPMVKHRVKVAVGADGALAAWRSDVASKSIFTGTPMEQMMVHEGVDHASVEGVTDTQYAIPAMQVSVRNMETPVPVLWWRAVGNSHTAYAMEVGMDMAAEAAGADPVAFREGLLGGSPRLLGVLKLAAEKAGWGNDLPEGWGRGVAAHFSFNSYVAQVAEVSTDADGRVKLERIVAAVDCGVAVNPDVIRAQIEGGIGFGLGHAMRQKITFDGGEVVQSNFPDYEPLRITDMPEIEVHIVPSAEAPTGVGEPGLPPAAPAVANAIYNATGTRVLRLPMVDAGIEFA
ncbi:xanthine dehydrogenase family protein molybdopterin-binding subunit [Vannielia litorea]|uniref:xanthine dehydrogenase family protein molybdopterin-binding subunit n=1 Tax=Vannielia litorea TaxID=1217970 RepID=UPI001C971858|nr:xanthine dehydrogenase family protein molybdopterin-binding subunit [Vannielia litorea]MBY6154131.1 xanthine dehydrogenase family protein molybdopterin-binding subunit [Vannielia litorea]